MTVHSTQLGVNNAIGTGGATLYTVPTGKRTIVKSIVLQAGAAASQRVIISVYSGATQLLAFGVTLGASASATESMRIDLWMVLNAGQSLHVAPIASTVQAIASGAELGV